MVLALETVNWQKASGFENVSRRFPRGSVGGGKLLTRLAIGPDVRRDGGYPVLLPAACCPAVSVWQADPAVDNDVWADEEPRHGNLLTLC